MESSQPTSMRTRPLHLSNDDSSEEKPVSRVNRRRSVDNNLSLSTRSSIYRVDPYRYENNATFSRRNSGTHQTSYPPSARYYASSNSSSLSSGATGHYNPSNTAANQFHHPLHHQILPSSTYHASSNRNRVAHAHHGMLSQPQGLTAAVRYTLKLQAQKVADRLVNHSSMGRSSSKERKDPIINSNFRRLEIFQNLFILLMPVMLLIIVSHKVAKHAPVVLEKATRPEPFKWRPNRRLNNRQCTLNMFVDKQAPNEFNPDFEEIKPGEKNNDGTPKLPTPPKLEPGGTYRTKGQISVIKRFISSVADSFRPQANMQQHLVFTGTRDGGHLAEIALKFWPPRGNFVTQLYIVSDPHDDHSVHPKNSTHYHENDLSGRALEYGALSSIEERFQNHKMSDHIHIFDPKGQRAGLVRSDLDDDDVVQLKQEEMFDMYDDQVSVDVFDDDLVLERRRRTSLLDNETSTLQNEHEFFSLKKLLSQFLDVNEDSNSLTTQEENSATSEEDKTKHVIPYFHVDGRSANQKFEILESAMPLLQDNMIVTVGVENSPDLDVPALIDFFREVKYKTFFLGKRQIMRLDHLCPEILEEVISHPLIRKKGTHRIRKMLQYFGIIPQEKDAHIIHPHPENEMLFPAFFVATPRGRHSKEEMTIQHMYDLFGGGGGGGQVATANDRKAPGKKKKK